MPRLIKSIAALSVMAVSSVVLAAPFTPGNVVVYRVGDGVAGLTTASVRSAVLEITPSGSIVQTIDMPVTDSGAMQTCTNAGSSTTEGMMTLSANGQYLVVGCYDAAVATAAIAGTTPAAVNRVVARIDLNGVVDTTTAINTATVTGNIRSVASNDGNGFWIGTSSGGYHHTTFGAAPTVTQIVSSPTNARTTLVNGGQLYGASQTGAFRVFTIGSGLPTSTGQTLTNLPGIPTTTTSPNQFFFADLNAGVAGVDVLYVTDDTTATGGIRKYSLVTGSWTENGVIDVGSTTHRGITGVVSGSSVTLYSTKANGANLVTVTDTAGYNAVPSPLVVTNVHTAGANFAYRGVAFLPVTATTPALSIADLTEAEGQLACGASDQRNATVTINASAPAPAGGMSVTLATSDATATATEGNSKQDYLAFNNTVNFAVGETSKTANITIVCDNLPGSDEVINLTLSNSVNATINDGSGTITLTNDDGALGSIGFSSASSSVTEGNTGTAAMGFPLTLPSRENQISITYETSDGTATTANSDYVAVSSSSAIAYSSPNLALQVTINGDTSIELDESFTLTLTGINGAPAGTTVATGTILTDDFAAVPTITIDNQSVTEGDTGTSTLTFTATISPALTSGTVTVDAMTANDTALSGSDYTALAAPQTLTFTPSVSTQTVTVNVLNDCTIESPASEQFFVNLSNLTGTATIGDAQGVGTITDNDVAITASIAVAPLNADEGNTGTNARTVTVSVSPAMQCGDFVFSVNTAGSSATSGTDFIPFSINSSSVLQGGTQSTATLTILGDLLNESDETVLLNLTGSGTNVTIGTNQATATIVNDDLSAPVTIAQIQGNGVESSMVGTGIVTLGNVVTAVTTNSFTMQMPSPGDSNPLTSDGILVFTGGAPTVQVGDVVDVRGNVIEFPTTGTPTQRITEFSGGLTVNVVSNGATLPTAVTLDANTPSPLSTAPTCMGAGSAIPSTALLKIQNFECMEFMRVTTTTGIVNAPNQTFGGASPDPYAEMWINTRGVRAFREPGVDFNAANETVNTAIISPPAPPLPGLVWDRNPELFELDANRIDIATLNNVLSPGTTFSATGILAGEFNDYELWPLPGQLTVNSAGPVLPVAVPTANTSQLTVGSLNLFRLYDRCNDPARPSSGEPTPNIANFDIKLAKISLYIRSILKSPVILGVQEAEQPSAPTTVCSNPPETPISALQLLADKILADGGPTYTVVYPALTNDPGYINVGYLYRADVLSNVVTTQLNAGSTWTFNYTDGNGAPTASTDTLHDRPPFLLTADLNMPGNPSQPVAVMVNHTRSLNGIDDNRDTRASGDPLTARTFHQDAHRVRQKRMRQAIDIACLTQTFQSQNQYTPLVLVGDFNTFEFSDGYADVAGIIRGDTNPANSEYDIGFDGTPPAPCLVTGGQITSPALIEAVETLPEAQQYSYVFEGNAQVLDHAFLNVPATAKFDDLAYGRGNADAPERERANGVVTPGREAMGGSDHDGFVLYLDVATVTPRPDDLFKNGFE